MVAALPGAHTFPGTLGTDLSLNSLVACYSGGGIWQVALSSGIGW